MGKNFSTSINESGACNMKSADRFVSLSDCNDTPVFSLPLFGGLMVNKHGSRFMDEGTMPSTPCTAASRFCARAYTTW